MTATHERDRTTTIQALEQRLTMADINNDCKDAVRVAHYAKVYDEPALERRAWKLARRLGILPPHGSR